MYNVSEFKDILLKLEIIKYFIMTFTIDMIVEIPLNSNVKYEYDEISKRMRCDRIMTTSMLYPGNYGYIQGTLSGDMDPLDILLVCDYAIYPGTIVNVKVIGVLLTEDEHGEDEKLIAVPSNIVDGNYTNINSCEELGYKLNIIQHFFEHYKDNESDKWVKVIGFENTTIAEGLLNKSIDRCINEHKKKSPHGLPLRNSDVKVLLNYQKV